MTRRRHLPLLVPVVAAAMALAATGCGAQQGARADARSVEVGGAGAISVEAATVDWPANPRIAAVRMVVRNDTAVPDALLAVASPVAGRAEVHRSEVDADGQVTMVEQPRLEVAARSAVTFEPSGLHVMLTGITADLQVGDEVPLVLTFERAGEVRATALVVAPGSVGASEPSDDAKGPDGHDH